MYLFVMWQKKCYIIFKEIGVGVVLKCAISDALQNKKKSFCRLYQNRDFMDLTRIKIITLYNVSKNFIKSNNGNCECNCASWRLEKKIILCLKLLLKKNCSCSFDTRRISCVTSRLKHPSYFNINSSSTRKLKVTISCRELSQRRR